jgi:hypothetical protein
MLLTNTKIHYLGKCSFNRSPHKNSRCRPLSPQSPAFGGRRLRAGAKKPPSPSLRRATPRVLEVRSLGPESLVPGGWSLWPGKVLGGSGPKLRMKNGENTFWAGVSGPQRPESPALEKAETAETKTTITWASGLCFQWSWAHWNHNNELYKSMHRNIVVQPRRIKPNEERFDLSSKTNW